MNARYYNPQTGRFLSQDTYSGNVYEPWTQHLYAYCGNNPTNMIDPTGHVPRFDKPKEYKYNKSNNRDNVISAPTRNNGTNSDADTGETPDWLQSIFDFFLELFDAIFETHLGAVDSAVQNAKDTYAESLEIDQSVRNHYENIWRVGNGNYDLLPVILEKGVTREQYIDRCSRAYNEGGGGGTFASICAKPSPDMPISEIYGYLSIWDPDYHELAVGALRRAAIKYFPKTVFGEVLPGGDIIVDGIYDATSPYYVLE